MVGTDKRDNIARDLLAALDDEDLCDVELLPSSSRSSAVERPDNAGIQASRFVLSARSPVFKRMLYGSFKEAKSTTVSLNYSSAIVRAIVEYCRTDSIATFCHNTDTATESGIRQLVQLAKAADFLELVDMYEQVCRVARTKMTTHLPLTCAVLDEANVDGALWQTAFGILEGRPYIVLDSRFCNDDEDANKENSTAGGGIECLSPSTVLDVMRNPSVAAGELFLFRMLHRWYKHFGERDESEAFAVAHQCCRYMKFENIEPQVLFDEVQTCKFVSPDHIFGAVAKQALRASQCGVWNLSCRGAKSASCDRILVENCGCRNANGIYYRVAGLAHKGGLYSKREVPYGQDTIYTLSCSIKEDTMECRLFSTKLLTQGSLQQFQTMQRTSVIDPVFQPILQVLSIEPPADTTVPTQIRKYYRAKLSDGEYQLQATLSSSIQSLLEQQEIVDTTVIKVLEFGLYQLEDRTAIHLNNVSVVNSNPGHVFGEPIDLTASTAADANGNGAEDETGDATVKTLYACDAPADSGPDRHSPVPVSGWQVEEHGVAPSPTCTWMPATPLPDGGGSPRTARSISRSNSDSSGS